MSTPSLQLTAWTWLIWSVQVQLGSTGPISMSGPKLRVASGSQEDPGHRRAEQEAPREIPIPLTTEALAARGDSLPTFAELLLSPSPVQPALHLRRRLEALRNKTEREREWTSSCSTKSTTSPSKGKMERNHTKAWDPHHIRTWVPTDEMAVHRYYVVAGIARHE